MDRQELKDRGESGRTRKALSMERCQRSINLDPEDWLWATWRPRQPWPVSEAAPFNAREALARLSKLTASSDGLRWDWSPVRLGGALSPEEAGFWFTAISRVAQYNFFCLPPKQFACQLEQQLATGELNPGEVALRFSRKQAADVIRFSTSKLPPEIMLCLSLLLPLEDLVELILGYDAPGLQSGYSWSLGPALVGGFRRYVLPYLRDDQVEQLRQLVSPHLRCSQWPESPQHTPAPVFYLAACLGMSQELLEVVESWHHERYPGPFDYLHKPQWIIFGLGDPGLVERHLRRLRLTLKKPVYIRAWLAHTEYSALDVIKDSIVEGNDRSRGQELLETLALVKAPEAAPYMLELMGCSAVRGIARRWLRENPEHAIAGLSGVAAGRGPLAEQAIAFLSGTAQGSFHSFLDSFLEQQPAELADRLHQALAEYDRKRGEPLGEENTPGWLRLAGEEGGKRKRSLSGLWVTPQDLPPITVALQPEGIMSSDRETGTASEEHQNCCKKNEVIPLPRHSQGSMLEYRLNDSQVDGVLAALRKSRAGSPHPLISELKVRAESQSLEAFAWRLFELWLAEGAPPGEKWAMMALGFLGGDSTALKLTPLIRVWPGESQHHRAVLGLECLRAIGTDSALMQIHGLAQKLSFKGLKGKAMEMMEAIAEDRQLTRAQFEDRIVPDCGLDKHGSRTLDYGPRQFRLVLGPEMKPMIRDSSGKLRDNLPKPGARDDAKLAATADWKLLKKQISEVIKIQVLRLKQSMITSRRWQPEEFEKLLVRHPLMTNLARRLVWGAYDSRGKLLATFRVTEDQGYAGIRDETFEMGETFSIGIVHPIELSAQERDAWGELLSDYEIMPPFRQLGRPVYRLEGEEWESNEITRFREIELPTPLLVGMLDRMGWVRGTPQDAGAFYEHSRAFRGPEVTAIVQYDYISTGMLAATPERRIERCIFVPGFYTPQVRASEHQRVPLRQVDPVVLSEVLLELTTIVDRGRNG